MNLPINTIIIFELRAQGFARDQYFLSGFKKGNFDVPILFLRGLLTLSANVFIYSSVYLTHNIFVLPKYRLTLFFLEKNIPLIFEEKQICLCVTINLFNTILKSDHLLGIRIKESWNIFHFRYFLKQERIKQKKHSLHVYSLIEERIYHLLFLGYYTLLSLTLIK